MTTTVGPMTLELDADKPPNSGKLPVLRLERFYDDTIFRVINNFMVQVVVFG